MNQNDNDDGYKALSSFQRRTFSVDGYSDRYIRPIRSATDRKNRMIKQTSEDDYVCAPLPRINNRPSAQTCW